MKSVLIIEDYESIKSLYTDAFLRAGYEVETAESGSDGLKKTQHRAFDIIILDMLMIELSGMDFLKSFEATKHPQTTVIVVSNLDSSNIVQKAQDLGAVKYLIKSQYTPKQLVEAVQAIIAEKEEAEA